MKKILIVEDDKFLAIIYRVKLTKEGFETKIAQDGEEASKILESYVPDLILLDLVMPRKDGFTLLQEIKNNKKWHLIPIIVASNLGQKEDTEKAIKMGVDDYIIKTDLSMDDLIIKINSILTK